MNIYNLNNGNIEIYNIKPLEDKIKLFKQNEIKKIPENERVLKALTKKRYITYKKDVVYNNPMYVLKKSEDTDNEEILKNYLIENVSSGEIRRVQREDKDDYLFFLELVYPDLNKRIQLTEDLANLILIEREEFDYYILNIDNVDRIKELFEIEDNPKGIINLEDLKKLFNTNLIYEDYETKKYYLENSTKVYKKLLTTNNK